MPKLWQVSAIVDIIYKNKDVIISAGIGSGKNLPYPLILFIKGKAIILVISLTIALMTNQVCLPVIIFYCKL